MLGRFCLWPPYGVLPTSSISTIHHSPTFEHCAPLSLSYTLVLSPYIPCVVLRVCVFVGRVEGWRVQVCVFGAVCTSPCTVALVANAALHPFFTFHIVFCVTVVWVTGAGIAARCVEWWAFCPLSHLSFPSFHIGNSHAPCFLPFPFQNPII